MTVMRSEESAAQHAVHRFDIERRLGDVRKMVAALRSGALAAFDEGEEFRVVLDYVDDVMNAASAAVSALLLSAGPHRRAL